MTNPAFEEFLRDHKRLIAELFSSSGAERWTVSLEAFTRAAWQGIASAAAAEPSQIPELLSNLRVKDLALALGCSLGNEPAWDAFCAEFRPALYESGRALTHDEAQARELADSLLAELYGLDETKPGRNSRFAYFHGRSSLKTWLRAVLYQKFVNEYRHQKRFEELPEETAEPASHAGSVSAEDDRRYAEILGEAVESALRDLPAAEKLMLGFYYVQGLSLKQIGRMTGEHEATISRHLDALRKKLRRRIENYLTQVKKLAAFEMDRRLDFASRGALVKLEKVLKTE